MLQLIIDHRKDNEIMSVWIKIKSQEDVELSEDGETIDVHYGHDHNGNNYIEIPIEFLKSLLKKIAK